MDDPLCVRALEPAGAPSRQSDGVARSPRIHRDVAVARKTWLEESAVADAARVRGRDSFGGRVGAGRPAHRAIPVGAIRQPPGADRADVVAAAIDPRIA